MTIFTEEAKAEIKKYLPHYIVGSAFLTTSLVISGLIMNAVMFHTGQGVYAPQRNMPQQRISAKSSSDVIPSKIKVGKPFAENYKDKTKPLVVEFYTDWCGFSKKFTPVFKTASKSVKKANFSTVNCEAPENAELVKKYNINKFPTVLIINTKTEEQKELKLTQQSFLPAGLTQQLKEELK